MKFFYFSAFEDNSDIKWKPLKRLKFLFLLLQHVSLLVWKVKAHILYVASDQGVFIAASDMQNIDPQQQLWIVQLMDRWVYLRSDDSGQH